jgi:hypothetical protein
MVSLAELRARNVVPIWQEAVAVVQELIQTVKATTGSAELLPDLEHVALIPNGDVVALPGSPEPAVPVRHAAVMLKLLVDGVAVPPELDQFITRNVGEPPQYDSVAEFSRNLAFFERPGRRSDVERLVGRAIAAEQTSRADEELKRLKERAAEVAPPPQAPEMLQQHRQRSQSLPIAIVAGLGVIILGAGLWLWQRARAPQAPAAPATQSAEATAGQPAGAEGPAAGAGAAGGAGQAGGAGAAATPAMAPTDAGTQPPDPAAAAPDAAASTSASPPARGSLIQRAGDAVRSAVNTILGRSSDTPAAAAAEPAPATGTKSGNGTAQRPARRSTGSPPSRAVAAATPMSSSPPAPVPANAPAVATSAEVLPEEAPAVEAAPVAVFTSADPTVTPPVIVRPVLPREPPPNVPPEQIGTIEVVVDEQGDVLSVRLISPANRFHERMLVSAAKMWKFRPAYKDGQPVRYRTRVRLTI